MKKNYAKIREIVRYLIVGVLTTVVSLGIYYLLVYTILDPSNPISLQIANVVSWIGAVLFAYVTNRKFVFQSKNEHVKKEALSFFGSRVVTLLMDMAIMFVGVSVLRYSDKWMKLVSQVVITVLNYVFSKLFVFRKKEKKVRVKKQFSIVYFLYLLPFLDFAIYSFQDVKVVWFISLFFKAGLFLYFACRVYLTPKYRFSLSFLLGYCVVELLYVYCQGYDVVPMLYFLLQVFLFPVAFFYFKKYDDPKIGEDYLFHLFVIYFLMFFLPLCFPTTFSILANFVLVIIVGLIPFVVLKLIEHKNYLTKTIGFLLILWAILCWQSKILAVAYIVSLLIYTIYKRSKNLWIWCFVLLSLGVSLIGVLPNTSFSQENMYEKYFLDDRLDLLHDKQEEFVSSNIEEQWFGLYGLSNTLVGIDFADIFYSLGYVGFVFTMLILGMVLYAYRVKLYGLLGLLFLIIMSFVSGGVFINGSLGIILASMVNVSRKEKKKRILIISNMYPSKRFKHYGAFVKNCKVLLEESGYRVDLAVKKKNVSFVMKFLGYSFMYIQALFKSVFYSYDYYYVHFVSQSTYAALLGKFTGKTKLVCNVHGNDIVPDYEFEEKNVRRSKFVLRFADVFVCPSEYFCDVLQSEYHIQADKLCIFPSGGVNLEVMKPMDKDACCRDLGLDSSCTYYGMVSRLEKDKGFDVFLNAMHELDKQKRLKNVKVLVIGTGDLQSEFDSLICKYHLEDKVIQKDFVLQNDLVKYYNVMDLFVFPTKRKSESLGLVGLEAMACKTFVIGNNLYGPRVYLKNKENALTYRQDAELAKEIKVYQDMSLKEKEKILQAGYETACQYDSKVLKEKLATIFE